MIKLFCVLLVLVSCLAQNEEAQMFQMRRTACLILSRYFASSNRPMVDRTLETVRPENQQKFINKMYVQSVKLCEPQINDMEVSEFYTEKEKFDPSIMFYLMQGLDYDYMAQNLDLTPDEQMILDFITQFDKDMEMRREEEEAKKYQEDLEKPSTIKIMGFSVDDIPSQFKLIYVVIFLLVVGGALYYGLSEVTKKKEKVSSKRRKSPKREESKKLSPKKDEKKNASQNKKD